MHLGPYRAQKSGRGGRKTVIIPIINQIQSGTLGGGRLCGPLTGCFIHDDGGTADIRYWDLSDYLHVGGQARRDVSIKIISFGCKFSHFSVLTHRNGLR